MGDLDEINRELCCDDPPINIGLIHGQPVNCREPKDYVNKMNHSAQTCSKKRLYLAAFSANLLFVSTGCALTWTSPAIPKLKQQNFSENDITWITSIQPFGAIFGPALFTLSLDRFGRKWSLILNASTFLLAWLMLAVSMESVPVLKLGRFIGGLGVGASFNSVPVYITEIADVRCGSDPTQAFIFPLSPPTTSLIRRLGHQRTLPASPSKGVVAVLSTTVDSRQMLTSVTELFISIGYVLTYSAGPYVDFVPLAVICALPAIIFIIVMLTMPESPYYSIAISNKEEAVKTLNWLRGGTADKAEIDVIQAAVDEGKLYTGEKKDLFLKRGPRIALILTIMMLYIQQVSAVDVITTYTEQIFQQTSVPLQPSSSAIVVGVVNLVSSLGAAPVVQRWGSKLVLGVTTFICGLSLLCFGTYQYLDDNKVCDLTSLNALPLVCILVFNIFFCIGLGSLPWAIAAELFPPSLKGFALLISSGLAWCFSFILLYTYGSLHSIIGTSTLFFFYGANVVIGSVLIAICVPNTTGKSLKEITDKLDKSKTNKINDKT